jgi:hypothetical protein
MKVWERSIVLADGWEADIWRDSGDYYADVYNHNGIMVGTTRGYGYMSQAIAAARQFQRDRQHEIAQLRRAHICL